MMIKRNKTAWWLLDRRCSHKSLYWGMWHVLAGLLVLSIAGLFGCATGSEVEIPAPLRPPLEEPAAIKTQSADSSPAASRIGAVPREPHFSLNPALPSPERSTALVKPAVQQLGSQGQRQITVNIEGLAVPAFINEVYGNLLGLSFQMDSGVQGKKEVVNLRLTQPKSLSEVRKLADLTLKDYGVAVEQRGEILRFLTGAAPGGDSPVFVFGARLPAGLNDETPVAQLIPIEAVRGNQIAGWLRRAYQGQKLDVGEDGERNAIVLWGSVGIVRQAGEVVRLLDQPFMSGRQSLRIEPANWVASQLARRLDEVLQAEGYSTAQKAGAGGSVLLLPIDEINAILVFAVDGQILAHVQQWVERLDQSRQDPEREGLFYYLAKNVPAENLAKTLSPLLPSLVREQTPTLAGAVPTSLGMAASTNPSVAANPLVAANLALTQRSQSGNGKTSAFATNLTVDSARNALIFSGSGEQWERLRPVLETMDQPAKLALIEVTVAEITLSDTQDTGLEWILENVNIGNWQGTLSNTLDLGTKGFNYLLTQPDGSRILLNALATNGRVSILSNPRVMVRNGEEASIDVGTEVPIITSQSTTEGTGTSGNPAILQQIQYRKTGVLLKVKPTIYAGRRVDLAVEQEVSEAQSNTTSSISSPQILNRKINTSLSLKDGGSVLLGGLMSTNRSVSNRGLPLIKDIPVLGYLFRADSLSSNRTELVVLITPYILSDEREAEAITQAFRGRLSMEPPAVSAGRHVPASGVVDNPVAR